jgi:transposase
MNPPTNAAVFSFDEKSQIQALQRAQPILPMDLGQPERRTHNYIRNGTLDLFAALNVATGEVLARCKSRHRAADFVAFLREIDARVAPGPEVHIVLDNLSAHIAPAVHRWLLRHAGFHLHFTPTYASWLNLVERFFGMLTEKRCGEDRIPAWLICARRSWRTWPRTTRRASRSHGPRPQMRSSTRSGDLVCLLNRCMLSNGLLSVNTDPGGL